MNIAPLLAPLFGFLLRGVVVKFVVFTAVFGLVGILAPVLLGYLAPFLGVSSLTSAFTGIPPGVWFFADFLQIGFGVPLCLSAYVTRFVIRRLPVIG